MPNYETKPDSKDFYISNLQSADKKLNTDDIYTLAIMKGENFRFLLRNGSFNKDILTITFNVHFDDDESLERFKKSTTYYVECGHFYAIDFINEYNNKWLKSNLIKESIWSEKGVNISEFKTETYY